MYKKIPFVIFRIHISRRTKEVKFISECIVNGCHWQWIEKEAEQTSLLTPTFFDLHTMRCKFHFGNAVLSYEL